MISSRSILTLAAAAVLGTGLAWSPLAQAQSSGAPPSPSATAPDMNSSASSHGATAPRNSPVEARITQLHRQLKITSAQQDDWNQVAQDIRDDAQQMGTLVQQRADAAKTKPMTAADNLNNYAQIESAHADALKKLAPDFEKLYDSMSPAQKKNADKLFNQRISQRVRATSTPSSRPHG